MNENSQRSQLNYKTWLQGATQQLQQIGISSSRLDSEIILAHTIGKPRTFVHAHLDDILTDRQHEIADARVDLRITRVPLAYIIGHKDFYGRQFKVTTATLVPRPESEIMIELLKEVIGSNISLIPEKPKRLIDVGTGSGILGITAKLEYPELIVDLLDISAHALRIAEQNAEILHAEVRTTKSDLLQNYPFKADYILANLPYVDPEWERSPETNHEPEQALFADDEGLALIYKLIRQTPDSLLNGGYLFLEADPVQHAAIVKFAKEYNLMLHEKRDYQVVLRRES